MISKQTAPLHLHKQHISHVGRSVALGRPTDHEGRLQVSQIQERLHILAWRVPPVLGGGTEVSDAPNGAGRVHGPREEPAQQRRGIEVYVRAAQKTQDER